MIMMSNKVRTLGLTLRLLLMYQKTSLCMESWVSSPSSWERVYRREESSSKTNGQQLNVCIDRSKSENPTHNSSRHSLILSLMPSSIAHYTSTPFNTSNNHLSRNTRGIDSLNGHFSLTWGTGMSCIYGMQMTDGRIKIEERMGQTFGFQSFVQRHFWLRWSWGQRISKSKIFHDLHF